MTKIFLDTNIILDLLGERVPFFDAVAKVATLADQKKIILVASPLSFVTIDYILKKFEPSVDVMNKLLKFNILCEVCTVDSTIIEKALNSTFTDFEDAVQYFAALQSDCSVILTRNAKDFRASTIPIMSVEEYLRFFLQN